MVWLAGCGGDGDGDDPTDTEGDGNGDDPTDTDEDGDGDMVEMIRGTRDDPAGLNMHDPWGPPDVVQHPSRWGHYLFPPPVYLFSNIRETRSVLASDFGSDGDTAFVELEEGLTWHNGDDFTTESMKIFWDIESQMLEHNESSTIVNDYEMVSDRRFEWDLDGPVRPDFAYDVLLDRHYSYHPEPFGEFQERAQDTTPGSDEFGTLVTDMANTREITVGGDPLIGYGPFEFVNRNSSEAVLDKWDDYIHADDIEVDRMRVRNVEDEIAAFQNENTTLLRAGLPAAPDVMEQMPPHHEFGFDRLQGKCVPFNMGWNSETGDWKAGYIGDDGSGRRWEVDAKKPTYERPMRHAMAHVLDAEFITQAEGPSWDVFDFIEGRVSPVDIEEGNIDTSPFYNHYENAPNEDRAIELVNASRDYVYEDDEVIFEPTGEVAQFRILGSDDLSQAVASVMDEFGFNGSIAQNMERMENPVESYRDNTAMPPTVDPGAFNIDWFSQLYAMPPTQRVPEFGEIDLESPAASADD